MATPYNLSGTYMGRSRDISIDIQQAKHLEDKLSVVAPTFSSVQYVISSPAYRCLQTSDLVMHVVGSSAKIVIENGFMETNMGYFEGKNTAQVRDAYPGEYKMWLEASPEFAFPDGESYLQVQQRSYTALAGVVRMYRDSGDLVIVTHVDVIKMLLFKILSISAAMKKYIHIDTGSISCIETYNDGYKIKFVNL